MAFMICCIVWGCPASNRGPKNIAKTTRRPCSNGSTTSLFCPAGPRGTPRQGRRNLVPERSEDRSARNTDGRLGRNRNPADDVKADRYEWVYLFGAVYPKTGESSALIAPTVNTNYMNAHLKFISEQVGPKTQVAHIGKTTIGWFFGFKLHLLINDQGGLVSYRLTAGHVDDRVPVAAISRGLFGKLFGDKGYISQSLLETLLGKGVKLITYLRKNMKPGLMEFADKILLRKRSLIETVNDTLKNV
jgi:hypothetical protein